MDRLLANLSIGLNLTLLFTNLVASVLSGSLSIVSTFVDSLMDVTSGLIIGICLKLIKNTNTFNYPRGRNRWNERVKTSKEREIFEIGIGRSHHLFYSHGNFQHTFGHGINKINFRGRCLWSFFLPHTSFLFQINPVMDIPTFGIMLGGSSVKIVLCLVCYSRGTSSSKVLAMDMRNDVVTSIVAIVCATIGDRYWPYADPLGAILVWWVCSIYREYSRK